MCAAQPDTMGLGSLLFGGDWAVGGFERGSAGNKNGA